MISLIMNNISNATADIRITSLQPAAEPSGGTMHVQRIGDEPGGSIRVSGAARLPGEPA